MSTVSVENAQVLLGRQTILDGVDLQVDSGEIVGIIGRNGSGKSTLLRLIVGLIRPAAGTVDLFGGTRREDALKRVGAVIDNPAFYPWMSARGVLRTMLDLGGQPDRGQSRAALAKFGLENTGRKRIVRFSQGMRRRLALATASLGHPDLLLLDEPTNALDSAGRSLAENWITRHRSEGGAAIVTTHRIGDMKLCDRVLRLEDGRLKQVDATSWAIDSDIEI